MDDRKPAASSKAPPPKEVHLTSLDLDAPLLNPQVQLRRSGRGTTLKTLYPHDILGPGVGYMLEVSSQGGEGADSKEAQDRKKTAREDMQLAIEGLARMERRLRSATKRQKLQIEQDSQHSETCRIDVEEAPRAAPAAMVDAPRIVLPTKAPTKPAQLPTPEEEKGNVARDNGGATGQAPESRSMDTPEEAPAEAPDAPERGAARPPAVNSSYLPLPWKGRLGYACLNTYLRSAKTPVFCSRTCRLASIIEHRHPLADPSQPEHAVKNRPDKSQEPSNERGEKFVQNLGLANARDIVRLLRWNDKYGIKMMRLSSGMFPFASHPAHGYRLAPFASEVLAEAGRVAARLGHRLTAHPGQYIQLGSPRREVIDNSVRDLEFHAEMLSLLRLPYQQDRDAVMVLHMGGVHGDKAATIGRFRKNYANLSPGVKARLVLENDDVGWSVHDLLPVCEELNIPLVLDFHHHNIIFDSTRCREGSLDISDPELQNRIAATWSRKGIRQKMHYSEPVPGTVTPRDRRKHSPRVMTLPPCPPDMDLMIEAKDKEQAVFELMRTFKLPGFEKINDMIPHEREDEPRPVAAGPEKKQKYSGNLKRKRAPGEEPPEPNDRDADTDAPAGLEVSEEDYAMGGPLGRVYWPPGQEDWLKPARRGAKPLRTDDWEDEC